ncbi:GntR family transcriptional regulator [Paracoccus aerius]
MTSIPNTLRIRRALENSIVRGRFLPGTRLDPEALAQEFDCSRTPSARRSSSLKPRGWSA